MSDYLSISIRFLDGAFHGRADYGEPEWPPSPLRIFQAIVAASAARWNERRGVHYAAPALRWFEQLKSPVIVTPPLKSITARGYRLYVPDNVGDLVGKSWSHGGEGSMADYRTEKTVRPTLFQDGEAVYYLWLLADAPEGFAKYRDTLFAAVSSIAHVGWGVDLVVADAAVLNETDAAALKGQRYFPTDEETDRPLRVPQAGTLDDLENRHRAFLNRVSGDGFAPVPPLAVYGIANYRSENEPPRALCAVFTLRQLDDNGFRPFDTARRGLHVAGMLRHIANDPDFSQSIGWSEKEIRRMVQGHGEERGQQHQPVQGARLAFLPLPSIEFRGDEKKVVGSIRRVLVTAFGALERGLFRRFERQFDGQELVDEKLNKPVALLAKQTENDGAIRWYFESATTWATVTPVILPGYDDPRKLRQRLRVESTAKLTAEEKSALLLKLDKRIEFLLRKAIRQAGFSDALAQHAELEWRSTGFWPGTDLASRYAVPDQHRRYRRLHVRITWRSPEGNSIEIPGPICIGGGKFSGLGLMMHDGT
ncbi:MAG: type I-U CRISPR-associated protein Cas5/Cas6 [Verrucomicrobia bacterium]|nr:type I-U CRISPR-associated protein Cas5/Cas6 [Verrucomicrobiota bacterium]MDE3098330.1 type I-U CRISPR-associated protein Cas5/Cas6 [Verrucomicrobiota bacterium]